MVAKLKTNKFKKYLNEIITGIFSSFIQHVK